MLNKVQSTPNAGGIQEICRYRVYKAKLANDG